MSRTSIIILTVVSVAALGLGAAGLYFSLQARNNGTGLPNFGMNQNWGAGRSDRSGQMGQGMMDGNLRGQGNTSNRVDLQQYLLQALAKKLNMSETELSTQLNDGKSLLEMDATQGMTVKEFNTTLNDARTAAIDMALSDGVISKVQADQYKANQSGWMMGGFGLGICR